MAELTTPAETTPSSCCAPEAQATCCEPSAKVECCDPSHGEGCGCAADTTTTQGGDIQTLDPLVLEILKRIQCSRKKAIDLRGTYHHLEQILKPYCWINERTRLESLPSSPVIVRSTRLVDAVREVGEAS